MPNLKPMLAAKGLTDLDSVRYPVLASYKLDGIRCMIVNGEAVSRTLKPIRNYHIQGLLGRPQYSGLDGEIIVGSPTDKRCMQNTTSGVMSANGYPDFHFYAFDRWDSDDSFIHRRSLIAAYHRFPDYIVPHVHEHILNAEELAAYEKLALRAGYEGVVLRDPAGLYKFGRATLREGGMTALKRFKDAEAIIVGVEELYSNANEATINALGHTERSSHQENKIPMGTLGALICQPLTGFSSTFNIGTGFDASTRDIFWRNRGALIGRIAKFKYFEVGTKDRPRHPVFLGLRDPEDM